MNSIKRFIARWKWWIKVRTTEKAIEVWEDKIDKLRRGKEHLIKMGADACPLCRKYVRNWCEECPIAQKTKHSNCCETPYTNARYRLDSLLVNNTQENRDKAIEAFRTEVLFLRTILIDVKKQRP